MLTVSPDELLRDWLIRPAYNWSGNLSCGSDILNPLRHVQLKAAGAPTKPEALMPLVRMETGTLWHRKFEDMFRRKKQLVMLETKLNDYLPAGWAGVADWIMWSDEYKAFVLGDLKTANPATFGFLRRDGIKEAHLWQLSAYFWALKRAGLPLVKAVVVMYMPLTDEGEEPLIIEGRPLDEELVISTMEERRRHVDEYLAEIAAERERWSVETGQHQLDYPTDDDILNSKLAPVQPRIQKAAWDGKKFQYDMKLAPHWSAAYCPYPDEFCNCSTQKENKIGHYYLDVATGEIAYKPRKEYESIEPIELTAGQLTKMQREIAAARKEANE